MTLTMGSGPFGPWPGGAFNFERQGPAHVLYLEDSPRRVRVDAAGHTVADSRRAKLLHETGLPPVYYLPVADVRMDLLRATEHRTHCPFKGDAAWWSVVGERVVDNAVWSYPQPLDHAPDLAGYLAFDWDAMDAWYEEDERVFGHARDPYHRVDVVPSSRPVTVTVANHVVASSRRPRVLFETGLPPRWYLPWEDVATGHLVGSDTRTRCPYKGLASYWSVKAGEDVVDDAVWAYPEPHAGVAAIAGHACFVEERVDQALDE